MSIYFSLFVSRGVIIYQRTHERIRRHCIARAHTCTRRRTEIGGVYPRLDGGVSLAISVSLARVSGIVERGRVCRAPGARVSRQIRETQGQARRYRCRCCNPTVPTSPQPLRRNLDQPFPTTLTTTESMHTLGIHAHPRLPDHYPTHTNHGPNSADQVS